MNSEVVELRVISLVNEQGATWKLLNYKIPRIHGSCTSHKVCQNGISDKDLSNSINSKFLQDGIVGGGNRVELLVFHALERLRLTSCNLIVRIIVRIEESAPQYILCCRNSCRSIQMFGQLGQIQLLHLDPVWLNRNRWASINAIVVPTVSSTTTSAATTSTTATSTATSATSWSLPSQSLLRNRRSTRILLTASIDLTKTRSVLTPTCSGCDKALGSGSL
mmetsp:Transcript_30147/g.72370  ORF Transcript_30147/g.72370 Transcript_30147/m.72370 type:complete len:221 (+) Transcript_30147:1035-1697(+)